MSDYASKKVAELKELLAARGLAVSGNKADLVARLEEADKGGDGDKAAEKTTETEASTETAAPAASTEAPAAAAAPTEVIEVTETETEAAPAAATETIDVDEEEPVISDEDKQKQAIEDLEKQIKRKKRFATGDNDADIAELEKQLERIKRFGASAAVSTGLSLDKGLDAIAKNRRKEGGKARRESVTAKDKKEAHPYKKSENGLKPGVKIATVDEEKIKARQARFSQ